MAEQTIELLPVLEQIEREKGIKKEDLLKTIEIALVSAFRKHEGNKDLNLEVHLDENTGKINAYHIKKIVENVVDSAMEISLEDAIKLKPNAKLEMNLRFEVAINEFGRIAAQTAKQVIIQKIREIEKDNLFAEQSSKIGQVLNGMVYKFLGQNIVVDIGKGEAILPIREQCPREKFNIGDRIKVYVLKVEKTPKGPQMVVSRIHIELIKNLFRLEVPEVYDNTVEIKDIVFEPSSRIKVAVLSHNPKVDAIGSCVGIKGVRIKSIIQELQGARIDMVAYSQDPVRYITGALSPAKVLTVNINESEKRANVLVADDQLSLAIGRDGQNVRLAVKLTGYRIDIKSESKKKAEELAKSEEKKELVEEKKEPENKEAVEETKETKEIKEEKVYDFTGLDGIGEKTAKILASAGFTTLESLTTATVESLTALDGIGEKTAQKIITAVVSGVGGRE